MKWTKILPILGFGLAVVSPAWAQDNEPEAAPAPKSDADEQGEVAADSSASAEGKFVLGLRLGYALPVGSLAEGSDMSDAISGQFPIWLDIGYMVTPNVMLGAYGQYAFGSVAGQIKTLCDQNSAAGISCSASDIRFGLQGQYHISPSEKFDPWLGLGVGYELMKVGVSGGGQEASTTASGFEFANLQAGADFKVVPKFVFGPFLSFSLGQYGSTSNSGAGAAQSPGGDIPNKALHEWLTFGVRGAFIL
jgi:outer membrane protein W